MKTLLKQSAASKTLWLVLILALGLCALPGLADEAATENPSDVLIEATQPVVPVLDGDPLWMDLSTAYICPGDNVCTRDRDCQVYFGMPDGVCVNPSGYTCSGVCYPC